MKTLCTTVFSGNKTGSAFVRFVAPVGCERALSALTNRIGDIPIKYPPTHDRAAETVIQLESPLDISLANRRFVNLRSELLTSISYCVLETV